MVCLLTFVASFLGVLSYVSFRTASEVVKTTWSPRRWWLSARSIPPNAPSPGTDPTKVNKWWNSLSSADQQQIVTQFPDYVGTTDGIPTKARDTANRAVLASSDQELTAAYNDPRNKENKYILKTKLIGIHDLETRLGSKAVTSEIDPKDPLRHLPGKSVPGQPYLLGFSADGLGRVILSIGLPDTADNIVTAVPGIGRGLNDVLYQDLSNNDSTTSGILNQGGQISKTAQIIWVGYDAPSGVFPLPTLDQAKVAAPALNLFQKGLVATHQGTPPHITVVGHSYGSDVVTEATINDHMLVADDVIFIGSPGVPVKHASQITHNMIPSHPGQNRLPQTQVWASKAGKDPVANYFSSFEGTDPTNTAFGASPFASDPQGDHGGYWQGIGLKNLANIELGNYDAVVAKNPTP